MSLHELGKVITGWK